MALLIGWFVLGFFIVFWGCATIFYMVGSFLARAYREDLPAAGTMILFSTADSKVPFKYRLLSFFGIAHVIVGNPKQLVIYRKLFYLH